MKSIPPLTIIPAGAGSGKTHHIKETLAAWVTDAAYGVAPDKIVAVTFTEAAAAEMRERVRAELVRRNRLDDAARLDSAYISTIHGFGLRLLREFAFDAGLPPVSRLLEEDEENTLIRRALARSPSGAEIMEQLEGFGYDYDFLSGDSAEDQFRKEILGMISRFRSLGRETGINAMYPVIEQEISQLYGTPQSAAMLNELLASSVSALLKKYPDNMAPTVSVKTARKELDSDFRRLKAVRTGKHLSDWNLWQKLRSMRVSNRNTKLSENYDDLARDVMAAADSLPVHPGPLETALNHARLLLGTVDESLQDYLANKKEHGLVDYGDMLAIAHAILTADPQVLATLRSRVDCLIIDEFQDTNPLQFSLLWALTRHGVPTLVVGDLKQAIMGFQHADARLMEALIRKPEVRVEPLGRNWRSVPALVQLTNALGPGLFGQGYEALAPAVSFTSHLSPLELLLSDKTASPKNWAANLAQRLLTLLIDPEQQVYDKKLGTHRRLRAGDIAVICPTNDMVKQYADVLRSAGLRCRMPSDGWFASRSVQLVCQALRYLADQSDRHAALYLAVTELGSHTLASAVEQLLAGELTDPLFEQLQVIAAGEPDRSVAQLCSETIRTLNLSPLLSNWPDGEQQRANLLRLEQECREFMTANLEALSCGGYHGSGLKTFLAWLTKRAERDDQQPDPRVVDEDAIELCTWHRSKGREWPVVAVCGTKKSVEPKLPDYAVAYEDFDQLDRLLEQARISIYPDYDAPESKAPLIEHLRPGAVQNAARVLYVALTRAREKMLLEWTDTLAKKDLLTFVRVAHLAGLEVGSNYLRIGEQQFPCRVIEIDRKLEIEPADHEEIQLPAGIGRRALRPEQYTGELTPDHLSPSQLHGSTASVPEVVNHRYAGEFRVQTGLEGTDRGQLLHRCFELLYDGMLDHTMLPALVGHDMAPELTCAVSAAVRSFADWVTSELKPLNHWHEEPFIAPDAAGTVVSGFIDLLLETQDGFWIIDHKSDQLDDESMIPERFAYYYPQLKAYADAISALHSDNPVKGVIVNWITLGMVTWGLENDDARPV